MNRRVAGYTMLEIVVVLAVFGIFLIILTALTAEMRGYEKRFPVNFMRHPQITAVLSRLRKDVQDAWPVGHMYPDEHDEYEQTDKTLIVRTLAPGSGSIQIVVWDFRTPGQVQRISYNVGVKTIWTARGLPPEFTGAVEIDAIEIPGREYGTRVVAYDKRGKLAIDQIFQPRAHE